MTVMFFVASGAITLRVLNITFADSCDSTVHKQLKTGSASPDDPVKIDSYKNWQMARQRKENV